MQSSSRSGARVRLIAVHTTEGIMRARDLIAFFNKAGASGSSHAGADETGTLLTPDHGYVPYDRAAWTLRNGNPLSDNLEFCGWARWTRAEWLARDAGLNAIALWIADRCRARGIPPVKLTPAEVRAGKSGVIGHVDWTQGMADGSHWDPGPGFPWDVVMAKVRWLLNPTPFEEDDMPTPQDLLNAKVTAADGKQYTVEQMLVLTNDWTVQAHNYARAGATEVASLRGEVAGLRAALEAIAKAPASAVDLAAVFKAAQDGARSIVDNLRVVADPS